MNDFPEWKDNQTPKIKIGEIVSKTFTGSPIFILGENYVLSISS